MKDHQENRLTMYQAVLAFLLLPIYAAIYAGNARITAAITYVQNAIARIRLYRMVQESDHTGLTAAKKQLEADLIGADLKLIDGLVPYATYTENADLLSKVSYSPTQLKKIRDNELVDVSNLLHSTAEPLGHDLESYGIDETDITATKALSDQYVIAIPSKRISDADRKTATENIDIEFVNTSAYLRDTFDNLMLQYRTSHSDFFRGYKTVREIINLGHRSKNPNGPAVWKNSYGGQVFDANTGEPVADVTMTLLETNQQVKTDAKGIFYHKIETVGDYTLTAFKDGYKLCTSDIQAINEGDHVFVEILLDPVEVPAE